MIKCQNSIANYYLNLGDESSLNFYGCSEGVDSSGNSNDSEDWCRNLKAKAHPVFFIISIVFLIITLFVYLAEDSLRCIKVNKHYCLEGLLSLLRGLLDFTDEPFWVHSKGLLLSTAINERSYCLKITDDRKPILEAPLPKKNYFR